MTSLIHYMNSFLTRYTPPPTPVQADLGQDRIALHHPSPQATKPGPRTALDQLRLLASLSGDTVAHSPTSPHGPSVQSKSAYYDQTFKPCPSTGEVTLASTPRLTTVNRHSFLPTAVVIDHQPLACQVIPGTIYAQGQTLSSVEMTAPATLPLPLAAAQAHCPQWPARTASVTDDHHATQRQGDPYGHAEGSRATSGDVPYPSASPTSFGRLAGLSAPRVLDTAGGSGTAVAIQEPSSFERMPVLRSADHYAPRPFIRAETPAPMYSYGSPAGFGLHTPRSRLLCFPVQDIDSTATGYVSFGLLPTEQEGSPSTLKTASLDLAQDGSQEATQGGQPLYLNIFNIHGRLPDQDIAARLSLDLTKSPCTYDPNDYRVW
ncbi:hypothetical protein H4R34_001452 [Dimargaris verticillata]|uniref:Uncharacterized protein n=1 Tax=Dimargaris verticillata TaxID=2761393 RepID=A0A9W8B655_9FUNG|nr:hypothetical protein H4R34_001452 [Dimargaris verticillata]